MSDILQVIDLKKDYEGFSLKNVSFSVPKGYVMGFVGPNGAGKTTTIKAILNMIHFKDGQIKVFGCDNKKDSFGYKEDVGVVMDMPFYVDDWTVKDVEAAVSPFYKKWDSNKYNTFLRELNITKKKKVKELSRGTKVKLMLAVALSHDARLLILDEPTSGLDPVARDELVDVIRDFMSEDGKGVLFSTHITSDLEKVADYVTYIKDGEIVFTGLKDDLIEGYALIKGGLSDITKEQRKFVIGLREHGVGFEGMVSSADVGKFSNDVSMEPVSLEEIMIYMNKGRE